MEEQLSGTSGADSIHNSASDGNEITMTLSLAAASAERLDDQISDVVGLLTLVSNEPRVRSCFTLVLKQLLLQAGFPPLRSQGPTSVQAKPRLVASSASSVETQGRTR